MEYSTDCGKLSISGSRFGGMLFVASFCKGSFFVQPDSLQIRFIPDHVKVREVTFWVGDNSKPQQNNDGFEVNNNYLDVKIIPFATEPVDLDTVTMLVLPSSYLLCNNTPLIKDTIRISLNSKVKRKR